MTFRFFLPGILAAILLIAGTGDLPLLQSLRTESTYGWWVVVLYPLTAVLAATQIVLCARWALRTLWMRRRS